MVILLIELSGLINCLIKKEGMMLEGRCIRRGVEEGSKGAHNHDTLYTCVKFSKSYKIIIK